MDGDRDAFMSYDGNYMMDYTWAEVTNGRLWRMKEGSISKYRAAQ
jgi:hypothetical protein